ncbi:MAG TPA: hypothetical protein ENI87_11785 [bacterium]|nr:hypothetical protein [bacterium]
MSQSLHYRPLACQRITGYRRLWPLARQEMLSVFRSKWGVALYLFCLLPALARLTMLMIMFGVIEFGPPSLRNRLGQSVPDGMAFLSPEHASFYLHDMLEARPGMIFFLLLTTLVVARSVARDRATNALELYWTRGISPWGYVFAKWWGGFLITASVTVGTPLLLWVTATLLADDYTLLQATAPQFLLGLAGMLLLTAVWTMIGTFVSASASSANAAMVVWCMLLVGTRAVGGILSGILHERELMSCLSFWEAGGVIVRSLADLPQERVWLGGAIATLSTLLVVTGLLARRRLAIGEALQ